MWLSWSILMCSLILWTSSSRCPEPKKPHRTSCTIFYNCVNLPGGGYVWVPSRCTDGLVFQPYLRVCVVPGDIWTCDTLSTDPSLMTNQYHDTAGSIDPTESSYLGYTREPAEFSETIDSSYVIEDDTSDLTTEAETPYPLIEFQEPQRQEVPITKPVTYSNKGVRNMSHPKEEQYLYGHLNDQKRPSTSTQSYKDIMNDYHKLLQELMSRLHDYKLSEPVKSSTTVNPTGTLTVFQTHDHKQNVSLNYLVQSYLIIGNGSYKEAKPSVETTVGCHDPETENIPTANQSTGTSLELLLDGLDADNNVIRITDSFGNERYLTVSKYRAVARQMRPRSVSVLACTKNVRLPNRTDCNRYYMCDPKTATIMEHSCPLHTAFNMNSRICDTDSAKVCRNDERAAGEATIYIDPKTDEDESLEDSLEEEEEEEEEPEEKPCREVGKVKDPTSDFHYYICYGASDSEEIKSVRMMCPNTLIFCQNKRVCTTKRLCVAS